MDGGIILSNRKKTQILGPKCHVSSLYICNMSSVLSKVGHDDRNQTRPCLQAVMKALLQTDFVLHLLSARIYLIIFN